MASDCRGGARSHHSRGVEKKDLVLLHLPRPAAMESNGNTPLPEDMNKPPEGMVLPPKDIKGASPVFSPRVNPANSAIQPSSRRPQAMSPGTDLSLKVRPVSL